MGYTYVWEFEVVAGQAAEFERHYGPGGTWAMLFARADGYVETLLLKDRAAPGRYVTVDRWRDEAAYRAFRSAFSAEYGQLDRECERLTTGERRLGEFVECPGDAC